MANIRVPDDLYDKLQAIKGNLLLEFGSEAPVVQDMVTVALSRLVQDWETGSNEQLRLELLESREKSRAKMGKRQH